jgi:hypothetical protein
MAPFSLERYKSILGQATLPTPIIDEEVRTDFPTADDLRQDAAKPELQLRLMRAGIVAAALVICQMPTDAEASRPMLENPSIKALAVLSPRTKQYEKATFGEPAVFEWNETRLRVRQFICEFSE